MKLGNVSKALLVLAGSLIVANFLAGCGGKTPTEAELQETRPSCQNGECIDTIKGPRSKIGVESSAMRPDPVRTNTIDTVRATQMMMQTQQPVLP